MCVTLWSHTLFLHGCSRVQSKVWARILFLFQSKGNCVWIYSITAHFSLKQSGHCIVHRLWAHSMSNKESLLRTDQGFKPLHYTTIILGLDKCIESSNINPSKEYAYLGRGEGSGQFSIMSEPWFGHNSLFITPNSENNALVYEILWKAWQILL